MSSDDNTEVGIPVSPAGSSQKVDDVGVSPTGQQLTRVTGEGSSNEKGDGQQTAKKENKDDSTPDVREEMAATRIQAAFRGMHARERVKEIKQQVYKLNNKKLNKK